MRARAEKSRAGLEVKLAALECENAALRAREAASLAREAANSRILQAIAAGPGEAAQALDMIAESASTLCGAYDAMIRLRDGADLVRGGHHGPIPTDNERLPISPRWTAGRCVLERRPIHVHDLQAACDDYPEGAEMARRLGHRTILSVPLLRGGEAIGVILLRRFEVNPFSEDDIALLATFADQAVIAVENTRLFTELSARHQEIAEALDRQTATSEILSTISSSPTDVRPVFDAIADSAARLCEAEFCHVFRFDGRLVDFVAHNYDESSSGPSMAAEVARDVFPMVPDASSAAGRVLLTGSLVNIADVHADPDYALGRIANLLGYRSIMGVPMLREGRAIGAITVMRSKIGAFADRQIDLLKTFADQAVIAIENTRLFGELHESLRQQTATADVLKAISQSAFDLHRVFEVVCDNALRLCGADKAFIFRFDGEVLRSVVAKNASPELLDFVAKNPIRPGRQTVTARAALLRQTVYIEDVSTDPDFTYGARDIDPLRTTLSVPILKGDELLGVITIFRLEVKPFTEHQIALVETFADQAAIAIENVRLLTDLREALQQQTAMADVLKAISRATFDLPSVLSTLVEAAVRLCDADQGTIAREQNGKFARVASHGFSPEFMAAVLDKPVTLDRGSASGRALVERRVVHIPDVALDPEYDFAEALQHGGFRTLIGVPMLRDGAPIGVFAMSRKDARPFTEKEIELVSSFADQAAIAIENARLFEAVQARTRDLEEALAYQTATTEILQVIGRSPSDAQPVFEAIVDAGRQLFPNAAISITLREGDSIVAAAVAEREPDLAAAFRRLFPIPLDRRYMHSRAIMDGVVVDIPDAAAAPADLQPGAGNFLRTGYSAVTIVPIFRGDRAIGALSVVRVAPGPLSSKERDLLSTFASQAVIAIENARLFEAVQGRTRELEQSLEQQTASGEILRAISSSPGDVGPVFETIVERAARLCDAEFSAVARFDGTMLHLVAVNNMLPSEKAAYHRIYPRPPTHGYVMGRAFLKGRPVQVEDVSADPDYDKATLDILRAAAPYRTYLGVPVLLKGSPIGAIGLGRRIVRPFTDREIALVQTFADQAVIAIENARLFTELETRNRELSEALEQQTATSAILRVIASSPADLAPVLRVVAENAARLCGAADAQIFRVDGDMLHLAASFGSIPIHRKEKVDRGWVTGRSVVDRRTIHVHDLASEPESEFPLGRQMQRQQGHRTTLATPLLKQGIVLGAILIRRMEVQPFSDDQIRLLETFADQAAIAIENARLFEALQARTSEVQEALEQQTATSEILRAISTSMTDAQPVFDTIVRNAVSLCDSLFANVFRFDGDCLHLVAGHNVDNSLKQYLEDKYPMRPDHSQVSGRAILTKNIVRLEDALRDDEYDQTFPAALGWRRFLGVPMFRKGEPIGVIVAGWAEPGPIPERQEELLRTFADQAVIAIENARLFTELEDRNRELGDALERQTATGEVLNVISRSPSDLRPVLEAIVATAARLCQAEWAVIFKREPDGRFHITVSHSNDEFVRFMSERPVTPDRGSVTGRTVLDAKPVHVADVLDDPEYTYLEPQSMGGYRTALGVPLMRGAEVIGVIFLARRIVQPFTDKQIELVTTFADQGVIAIENARLFEALQSALAEFNAVLDNIDYGVLFMDRDLRTRIVNPALRRLWDVPQEILDERPTLRELLEYNRGRGVYTTPPAEWDDWVAARIERVRQGSVAPGEFARADGKVYSYQCVALPDGGRMLSYFDITELKNRQAELLAAKEAAEAALAELRTAQERLVQSEKLASLGQLTAGIAHEIKNPLNFVNNFAALSRDLLEELEAVLQAPMAALEAAERDDAEDLFRTVRENLEKIAHHGKRADSIVKNMLLHARQGSGEWREADINAIAEEALNLAYHGARAGHPDFNVEIVKHLDPEAGTVECCPQDIMRVVLNLVSNGIYAANKKRATAPAGFGPRIEVTTRAEDVGVAVEVRDNGTGIPAEIRDRIFLPFFTTKPAGEGTGLGLSLSHDIVVKQHGGSFAVESEPGAFTLFRVLLPRHAAAGERVES